jgi:hypothetical protein
MVTDHAEVTVIIITVCRVAASTVSSSSRDCRPIANPREPIKNQSRHTPDLWGQKCGRSIQVNVLLELMTENAWRSSPLFDKRV